MNESVDNADHRGGRNSIDDDDSNGFKHGIRSEHTAYCRTSVSGFWIGTGQQQRSEVSRSTAMATIPPPVAVRVPLAQLQAPQFPQPRPKKRVRQPEQWKKTKVKQAKVHDKFRNCLIPIYQSVLPRLLYIYLPT